MLAGFFTKDSQKCLSVKLREVIIEWKNIDTLQMVLTSTKEHVDNVEEVNPTKNIEKK